MTMTYVCELTNDPPVRKITGLRVFSAGEYCAIDQIAIPDLYVARSFK